MNDHSLCEKLYAGDRKAFDRIYDKYWKRLFVFAYKILEDQPVCEDIVQEVFVKLWQRRQLKQIQQLENYLIKAVKYRVSNHIRDRRTKLPLESVLPELLEQANAVLILEEKETKRLVQESIFGLPAKCKEVYAMSRDESLSNKEIAQQLNLSVRTVEAHIHKALKSIKKSLGQINFW